MLAIARHEMAKSCICITHVRWHAHVSGVLGRGSFTCEGTSLDTFAFIGRHVVIPYYLPFRSLCCLYILFI